MAILGYLKRRMRFFAVLLLATAPAGAAIPVDLSDYRPGAVTVSAAEQTLEVSWRDDRDQPWKAVFSLEPRRPLITSISHGDTPLIRDARPLYQGETGKRRKGWNAFFDYPPENPAGTRPAKGIFEPRSARVRTQGNRVEIYFDGMRMGVFSGGLAYTFFPGGRLIQQEAVLSTDEPDTAYYYDAGLEFSGELQPGKNMKTTFAYYDTGGNLQHHVENGFQPERTPVKVRYRTLSAKTEGGSIAVFPAPHQYFFPRDFTSNLAHLWHRSWRGRVSVGIRQIRDTDWRFYPWMNAPPGSEQRMSVFFQLSAAAPAGALADVLRYTRGDRFESLPGYKTLSSHWHLAYTVQAMEHGFDWEPPFKPVLKEMGVDASIIMDFHGDGNPRDLTDLRLEQLDAFFQACKQQSDDDFLLIPSEEANVHYGGHWAVVFPRPVYWFMGRPRGGKGQMQHPQFGKVYSTSDKHEMLKLIQQEGGFAYQTHARTKGSTGYPDNTLDEIYFRDESYFGAGWKAIPSDPSSPRLGDRIFNLLDDLSAWGFRKRALGEVDVFQFDATHELYGHMNINYVRADTLPSFENYREILDPLVGGEFFVTTGEVLLAKVDLDTSTDDEIRVRADVRWTLPLAFAEVVWGKDGEVHRRDDPPRRNRRIRRTDLQLERQSAGLAMGARGGVGRRRRRRVREPRLALESSPRIERGEARSMDSPPNARTPEGCLYRLGRRNLHRSMSRSSSW